MNVKLNKHKIGVLLEYIIALGIIVEANSIWLNKDNTKIALNMILLSICIFIYIILNKKYIMKKFRFLNTSFLVILLIILNIGFILFNQGNIIRFILSFVILLSLFIVYSSIQIEKNSAESLLIKISHIMVILSVISLVFYVFGSVMKIINPSSYVMLDWGGKYSIPTYFGIHYETQMTQVNSIKLIRNTGVFTEAPMYSFILCIALSAQLFLNIKVNKINIAILLITIFSTISITGISTALFLIIIKSLTLKSHNSIVRLIKILTIPIFITIISSIGIFFIKDKIHASANNRVGSFSVRVEDFKVAFEAWSDNLFIGHGYYRNDLTQRYMSSIRGNDIGGSNSLITILPQGGLYLLLLYLIPFFMEIKNSIVSRNLNNLVMTITLIILFILTNIPYTYMMIYIIAKGWSTIGNRYNKITYRNCKKYYSKKINNLE